MIRSLKRALVSPIALLASTSAWILLGALPAVALSPVSVAGLSPDSKAMASFPGAETLCHGDCGGLLPLDLPLAQPDPFDFELGLRVFEQGLELTISSGANVYLVGPANATDRVVLRGAQVVLFETEINGNDLSIELDTSGDPKSPLPGLIELSSAIRLSADRDWAICGCITAETGIVVAGAGGSLELRASDAGDLRLEGGEIVLAAQAVAGGASSPPPPIGALSISRTGDVYVDLSGVTLRSLEVDATGALVVAGGSLAPVPEPGTVLLLGFGLATLAHDRAGSRR